MSSLNPEHKKVEETVEKYSDLLLRVAFTYMKNISDAEDIVQELFFKLVKDYPSFENDEHEKAWLIRVAINLSKNRLKSAWFRKTEPIYDVNLSFSDEERFVMDAVMELPSKYRTEVYEVKGMKRENAVLMVSGEMNHILYRTRKAVASENESIGLKVEEVINMISDSKIIGSVELRNEIDGSWMRTSYDNRLIELLNTEIKDKDILNYEEMRMSEFESSYRIPVNLILEDGAVLHMQVYPETNIAYTFGGYISISEELSLRFEELYRLGNEFSKIADIINYELSNLKYLKFKNHVTGDEILSPDPLWSGEVLYSMLNFYSIDKILSNIEGNLVFTVSLGESEENSKDLEIYEDVDKNLFFKVNGEIYRIVKGSLLYNDLLMYQENYTSY